MADTCGLCGTSNSDFKFHAEVLGRYDAKYVECLECGLLRVEEPSWLSQLDLVVADQTDIGLVTRTLEVAAVVRQLRAKKLIPHRARILDIGAGSGLLVRLLRDFGFDAYAYEPFRDPALAGQFKVQDPVQAGPCHLLTLIEVAEHFTRPMEQIRDLIPALNATGLLLLRTEIYEAEKHGPDWWYLDRTTGEHLSFFSRRSLQYLASELGGELCSDNSSYHLFSLTGTSRCAAWKSAMRWFRIERRALRFLRIWPGWGYINADPHSPDSANSL